MLIGYIVSIAALAIAMQTVLPPIWSGFQLVGNDMDPLSVDGATNGIILGSITIILCTIISAAGVRFMACITVTGVTLRDRRRGADHRRDVLHRRALTVAGGAGHRRHGTGIHPAAVPGLDADGRLRDVRIRFRRRAFRRDPGSGGAPRPRPSAMPCWCRSSAAA